MNKWSKFNPLQLFSRQCLFCLEPVRNPHSLCPGCEQALLKNGHHCLVCSIPLYPEQAGQPGLVCGHCQKDPPYYNTSLIPYLYASPLKQAISAMKFHNNLSYVPLLAHLFLRSMESRRSKMPECIIPVPLHPRRLQQRGFNQGLEILRIIARQLNIPLDYALCQRHKNTPFQSGLTSKQRKQNLRNAFTVTMPHQYKHVAIFDDVVTTGTTVNELAKKLRTSGVEIIEIWAIARTMEGGQKNQLRNLNINPGTVR